MYQGSVHENCAQDSLSEIFEWKEKNAHFV